MDTNGYPWSLEVLVPYRDSGLRELKWCFLVAYLKKFEGCSENWKCAWTLNLNGKLFLFSTGRPTNKHFIFILVCLVLLLYWLRQSYTTSILKIDVRMAIYCKNHNHVSRAHAFDVLIWNLYDSHHKYESDKQDTIQLNFVGI